MWGHSDQYNVGKELKFHGETITIYFTILTVVIRKEHHAFRKHLWGLFILTETDICYQVTP